MDHLKSVWKHYTTLCWKHSEVTKKVYITLAPGQQPSVWQREVVLVEPRFALGKF